MVSYQEVHLERIVNLFFSRQWFSVSFDLVFNRKCLQILWPRECVTYYNIMLIQICMCCPSEEGGGTYVRHRFELPEKVNEKFNFVV